MQGSSNKYLKPITKRFKAKELQIEFLRWIANNTKTNYIVFAIAGIVLTLAYIIARLAFPSILDHQIPLLWELLFRSIMLSVMFTGLGLARSRFWLNYYGSIITFSVTIFIVSMATMQLIGNLHSGDVIVAMWGISLIFTVPFIWLVVFVCSIALGIGTISSVLSWNEGEPFQVLAVSFFPILGTAVASFLRGYFVQIGMRKRFLSSKNLVCLMVLLGKEKIEEKKPHGENTDLLENNEANTIYMLEEDGNNLELNHEEYMENILNTWDEFLKFEVEESREMEEFSKRTSRSIKTTSTRLSSKINLHDMKAPLLRVRGFTHFNVDAYKVFTPGSVFLSVSDHMPALGLRMPVHEKEVQQIYEKNDYGFNIESIPAIQQVNTVLETKSSRFSLFFENKELEIRFKHWHSAALSRLRVTVVFMIFEMCILCIQDVFVTKDIPTMNLMLTARFVGYIIPGLFLALVIYMPMRLNRKYPILAFMHLHQIGLTVGGIGLVIAATWQFSIIQLGHFESKSAGELVVSLYFLAALRQTLFILGTLGLRIYLVVPGSILATTIAIVVQAVLLSFNPPYPSFMSYTVSELIIFLTVGWLVTYMLEKRQRREFLVEVAEKYAMKRIFDQSLGKI